MRHLRKRSLAARGYTLMELVISAMIALLVIAGLYVVYAGHSRVFRGQQMVSQAQVTARFAMDIVRNDLSRAGFMGVADTQDPATSQKLCRQPAVGRIQAIQLTHNSGAVVNASKNVTDGSDPLLRPSQAPDQLDLIGNYTDSESYWVERISGTTVTLQDNTAYDTTDPFPATPAEFNDVFNPTGKAGSVLARIRHQDKVHLSVVNGAAYAAKTVTITDAPGCLPGLWDGAEFNVVNWVRYRVVNAVLTKAESDILAGSVPLQNRLDLVREEINWNTGAPVSTQVVAENVVDFQVWFLFDQQEAPPTGPAIRQGTVAFPDNVTGNAPCGTGVIGVANACSATNIYGAVVRISVRTPREDPNFHMPRGVINPLYWYEVNPNSIGAARVRTLVTQTDMPNIGFGL